MRSFFIGLCLAATASLTYAATPITTQLGKPNRMLVGLGAGNSMSDMQAQGIHPDIIDTYLVGVGSGSWPYWNSPDGAYVTMTANQIDSVGATPLYTFYQMASTGGGVGGMNNTTFMSAYWSQAKLMFQKLGSFGKPVLVNMEPDFWGFIELSAPSHDPTLIAAAVQIQPECSSLPNTGAGIAQCLITLRNQYAPNAKVGFPASFFGEDAQTVGNYMFKLGAQNADFIVAQTSDRDAGCFEANPVPQECAGRGNGPFYLDESNQATPNYTQSIAQWKTVQQILNNLPILYWQTPMGVPSNTPGGSDNHYRDNHVHYMLGNPTQFTAFNVFAVVFSSGGSLQTTIATDGGQFQRALSAYLANPAPLIGGGSPGTPDAFSFPVQTGVALGSVATSSTITVTGINTATAISIVSGTYSVNGGPYTASAGTVNAADTVTVRQTSSTSYSTTTTSTLTIGGVSAPFSVTTLAPPPPPPPPPTTTTPSIPTLISAITIPGVTVIPNIADMGAGNGPDFMDAIVRLLSIALGTPLHYVGQNTQGTVTLSGLKGGNLAFIPSNFQNAGDRRTDGVYAMGDGRYQVVHNGQTLVIAPALVHLDQLVAMINATSARLGENGVFNATINGQTYAVQPGVAVQLGNASSRATLTMDGNGFWHFIDTQGNNQILFPAFADPGALRNGVLSLDPGATLSIQLDGTAALVFRGQGYTLLPDLTLMSTPASRIGQPFWQESATRYWLGNTQPAGTTQGVTARGTFTP